MLFSGWNRYFKRWPERELRDSPAFGFYLLKCCAFEEQTSGFFSFPFPFSGSRLSSWICHRACTYSSYFMTHKYQAHKPTIDPLDKGLQSFPHQRSKPDSSVTHSNLRVDCLRFFTCRNAKGGREFEQEGALRALFFCLCSQHHYLTRCHSSNYYISLLVNQSKVST